MLLCQLVDALLELEDEEVARFQPLRHLLLFLLHADDLHLRVLY